MEVRILLRFPGLKPTDDILSLLKLIASKDPISEISAKTAMAGGYDPCSMKIINSTFWETVSGESDLRQELF